MDLAWVQIATDFAASAGALSATISGQPWAHIATDLAVSGGLSMTIYGASAFVCVGAGTVIAGPLVGGTIGALAAGYIGHEAYVWTRDEVVEHFYERKMDPRAEQVGHLIGGIIGGIGGAHFGMKLGQAIRFAWQYPNYVTYEAEARALTERTFTANRQTIDPNRLRGPTHHLGHEIPVRQGYALRIPPAEIAAAPNLSIIPREQNLAAGAKFVQIPGGAPAVHWALLAQGALW
jgi:hypothetical protein